jgi:hypothetical protein
MPDLEREQAEMRERMRILAEQQRPVLMPPIGRHYKPEDLARALRMSLPTIRRLFEDEPGVIKIGHSGRGRVRKYVSLYIPELVVMRVYDRLKKNIVLVSRPKLSESKKATAAASREKRK